MTKDNLPVDYLDTVKEIKERIRGAQYRALRVVNKELIGLYWEIGRIIVEKQKNDPDSWGKGIINRLSLDLASEYVGPHGFSSSNLWRMRNFYEKYQDKENLAPLVRELSWTNNIIILEKCQNLLEIEFYLRMTTRFGWSKRTLIAKINDKTYERTMINQTNFDTALPEKIQTEAILTLKDQYSFEFLEMKEQFSEKELEKAILKNIPDFLREMGGMMAFIGNQFRLEVDNQEFFIDLVLYHRELECLVAIELKKGEFKPEYIGKMQFYLETLDRHIKKDSENPSIGIVLCRDKKRTVVEYTLARSNFPIGVSAYHIDEQQPKDLEKLLPNKKQIGQLFKGL